MHDGAIARADFDRPDVLVRAQVGGQAETPIKIIAGRKGRNA